ncbi:MAG: TRAM domain-containing protein [Acidobacteria bacterium]|nr:TRAM domain-containing protein [Acidobacteriota bacterium]MBS1865514.1 TRAM domain-containing protein [Acidobacteriota bacterium]
MAAEIRSRRAGIWDVIGAAAGSILGIFAAALVTLVVSRTAEPEPTKTFLEYTSLVGFGYLGLFLGAFKGRELPWNETVVAQSEARNGMQNDSDPKLLDTSVLIDGRIADICEAQFLDGPLHVPRFVLHELQQIADSPDALRRQRGRRGLEVLQRIQKMPQLKVLVLEDDEASEGEVDRKLVELAKRSGAKIITNDFNLNKVASVQGIAVLNVNQLANALRPAVLPGEPMRVFILREGKEANQGVAYLEDGTMVVVDGARRFLNKNVDVTVTSVHQTPAGKMIFGRMEDRTDSSPMSKQAAAGRGENGGRTAESPAADRATKREDHETS